MKKVKYSVIITAYNAEKYISECLESVIRQDFKNLEIIIVNDGSVDDTFKIAEEYHNKYPYIRVIHQENKGVGGAKQTGLDCSVGEWILFLDSDDLLAEGSLNKIDDAVRKMTKKDILIFNYATFDESRNYMPEIGFDIIENECNNPKKRYSVVPVTVCSKVFPAEIIRTKDIDMSDTRYYEDIATFFIWMACVNKIYSINEPLYLYRQNEVSITHGADCDRMIQITDVIEKQRQWLEKNGYMKKYYQRYEFYAITHILTEFVPGMLVRKDGRIYAEKCMKYMKNTFPGYMHNPYLADFSFRNKLYMALCEHEKWSLLKSLIIVKKTVRFLMEKIGMNGLINIYKKKAVYR